MLNTISIDTPKECSVWISWAKRDSDVRNLGELYTRLPSYLCSRRSTADAPSTALDKLNIYLSLYSQPGREKVVPLCCYSTLTPPGSLVQYCQQMPLLARFSKMGAQQQLDRLEVFLKFKSCRCLKQNTFQTPLLYPPIFMNTAKLRHLFQ